MQNKKIIKELIACAIEIRKSGFLALKEENVDEFKQCIEISVLTAEICEFAAMALGTAISEKDIYRLFEQCKEQLLACAQEFQKHKIDYCESCYTICLETVKAFHHYSE